ncbi:MAG: DNA integrity scanning protein DisA nucleotide-binding domain protein [Bacteroidia bacterium]|nr:DNA integrity scanning protein DisA nucleotide-binding domain protein [Bacteroidia bacterium]
MHFGLRHRAAIGLTENSDAIALVVSEETGNISISSKGEISYNVDKDKLEEKLEEHINAD